MAGGQTLLEQRLTLFDVRLVANAEGVEGTQGVFGVLIIPQGHGRKPAAAHVIELVDQHVTDCTNFPVKP